MKQYKLLIIALTLFAVIGCSKEEPVSGPSLDTIQISVPAQIKGYPGDEITINNVKDKGLMEGDVIELTSSGVGNDNYTVKPSSFSFILPAMKSGNYDFCIRRNDKVRTFRKVAFQILDASAKYCSSTTELCDEIIFSSGCGSKLTSVQQGFDFTQDDDYVYFSQVHTGGVNTIGWGPRTQISTEFKVTPNCMYFNFLSHGDNITIEKRGSDRYVWIGNYSTRASDGSYHNPQVFSVFKLVNGQRLNNYQATENYYFGVLNGHHSIDWDNDQIGVIGNGKINVYKCHSSFENHIRWRRHIHSRVHRQSHNQGARLPQLEAHLHLHVFIGQPRSRLADLVHQRR